MNMPINRYSNGCPYFSKKMQSCSVLCEGIYLPLRVHAITFCMTTMFNQCITFKQYHILTDCTGQVKYDESSKYAGRRCHHRIMEKRHVTLRTCDSQGTVIGNFLESAMTVDFSQGGMRLISNREMPPDTSLLFDFDNDFIIPHLQGIAQLCWHRQLNKNSSMIETGLVFKDHFSKSILASRIGK